MKQRRAATDCSERPFLYRLKRPGHHTGQSAEVAPDRRDLVRSEIIRHNQIRSIRGEEGGQPEITAFLTTSRHQRVIQLHFTPECTRRATLFTRTRTRLCIAATRAFDRASRAQARMMHSLRSLVHAHWKRRRSCRRRYPRCTAQPALVLRQTTDSLGRATGIGSH